MRTVKERGYKDRRYVHVEGLCVLEVKKGGTYDLLLKEQDHPYGSKGTTTDSKAL